MATRKITELTSGSLSSLPLTGVTTVVYSGVTFQHTLNHLRQVLVDSGSHVFTGSQTIKGDLTISGSLTAQQYILSSSVTNIVTETISGSTQFGNSFDDTHNFTGSVNITGSLLINGTSYTAATSGTSGTSGLDGSSGTSGESGSSGTSGTSGLEGSSGTSGESGSSGTSGTSGIGSSGTSGTSGTPLDVAQLPSGSLVGDNINSTLGGNTVEIDYGITKGDLANRFTGIKVYNYPYATGSLAGQVEIWTDSEALDFSTRRFYIDGFGTSTFESDVVVTGSLIVTNGITGSLLWSNLVNVPSLISGSSQITNLGFALTSSVQNITGSENQIRIINNSGTSSIALPSGTLAHSGSLHIGSSGGLQFGSIFLGQSVTGFLSTVSDGVFRFGDSSGGAGIGRIILGSVSTSFPSIKRDGAGISIRTADDSIFSFVSASKFITSGGTSNHFVKGDGSLDSSNIVSSSLQITNFGFASTGSNTFIGSQTINGQLDIKGVSESLIIDGGFSGSTFDYTSGSIFYLTGLTGNGTWDIINVPTTNNKAITITFVITQGVTPYSASAYQFNSSNVTVKWADSIIPSGSTNKTEIIGLTAFRVGSTWDVLGSLSSFGS